MDLSNQERLIEASATGRSLSGLDLSGVALRALKLDGLRLHDCRLDRADLTGASLRGAVFDGVKGLGANFAGASLDGSVFQNVVVSFSFFNDASMVGVDWTGCGLEYAFVLNADARNSRWRDTVTTGTVWAGTSLAYADLRGLANGQNIARWEACGTGAAEDRAALALFNHKLNTMTPKEARRAVEAWKQGLERVRSSGASEADMAAAVRLELATLYQTCSGESHRTSAEPIEDEKHQ